MDVDLIWQIQRTMGFMHLPHRVSMQPCTLTGNLLRGIVNCLGATRFVVQVRLKDPDNNFSKNLQALPLFQPEKIFATYGFHSEIINTISDFFFKKCVAQKMT